MDWVLLIGLAVAGALLLVAMTTMLRRPRRIPAWLPGAGMLVTGFLLAVAVVGGEWFTAVLFLLNLLVFSMLLGTSRRPPAP